MRAVARSSAGATSSGSGEGGEFPQVSTVVNQKATVTILTQDPELKKKKCGPDITNEFIDNIKKVMQKLRDAEARFVRDMRFAMDTPGERGDGQAMAAMGRYDSARYGAIWDGATRRGPVDYKNGKSPNNQRRQPVGDCPTDCPETVTLCGMCMRDDTPGNFALGFFCEYAGIGPIANLASHVDAFKNFKIDDDQSTVDAGRDGGGKARKNEEKGKKGDDDLKKAICGALSALKEKEKDDKDKFPECPACDPAK
jgi:hypothetical protein